MLSAYEIIQRVARRYVYYPVQSKWFKAAGGPEVDCSEVERVCKIFPEDLARYERLQSDGVDRRRQAVDGYQ